jgi:hypothetical protein
MLQLLLISLVLILFFLVKKESVDRKTYAVIGIVITLIFLLRFACDNITCISNNFLYNSTCNNICIECDSIKTDNFSIEQFKKTEKKCLGCIKCNADWNIRAAFDPAGLSLLGLLLTMIFLYKKDYSIETFVKGIETINLFGVLAFKISETEKKVTSLTNEMQSELVQLQKETLSNSRSIYQDSGTPFNLLHSFIEKIERKYDKLDNIFKQEEEVISLQKQDQFKRITTIVKELLLFIKQDKRNKYINEVLLLSKKILAILNSILDYIQYSSTLNNSKYLKESLGINIVDDRYSEIISKGSKIPIEKSDTYHTIADYQLSIESHILVGDDPIASNNREIGRLNITEIPKLPKGEAKITVLFKVDKFGLLIAKQICYETNHTEQDEFDINDFLTIKK